MKLKHLNFTSLRKGISSFFNQIKDWRQLSKVSISIHDALMSGVACMYFQDPSLLQFQKRLQDEQQRNNLQTLFDVKNIPKETQMREIIDQVDSEYFRPIFKDFYSRLQRGKHLLKYQLFPGLYLFPFDGTGYFTSEKIHCEHCLMKRNRSKGFNFELLLNIPQELTLRTKANTYILIGTSHFASGQYSLIDKFQKTSWKLFYIDNNEQQTDIEISEVTGLSEILRDKDLEKLSKDNNKKIIKKMLATYHANIHNKSEVVYTHQALQGGIMHPDQSVVIPFMPEEICNTDKGDKQDCEMNAGKRLVDKVCQEHPQLGIIFGGDSLFSRQPIIEKILNRKAHYIFTAKPADHKCLMGWLANQPSLEEKKFMDEKGQCHHYEWFNDVPLNGHANSIRVNFFQYKLLSSDSKIIFQNSWVTDLPVTLDTVETLVRGGRCRWKAENECFNVLKNHGYCLEHSYGHGENNLCFNFYLMTLLGFFIHQIFELTDDVYKAARKKFGSKNHMWETLRSYIKIIVFDTWETLLTFGLTPTSYTLTQVQAQAP